MSNTVNENLFYFRDGFEPVKYSGCVFPLVVNVVWYFLADDTQFTFRRVDQKACWRSYLVYINIIYYIDTDEIPGFLLSLKIHIFTTRSEDTFFLFHM